MTTKYAGANQFGVHPLADNNAVEYLDWGATKIKRTWNQDGTAAVDNVCSQEEWDAKHPKAHMASHPAPAQPPKKDK